VVAAGHPLTAEAGARVLREGGNAIDAAIASVLASFVTESPLTGLGAGGFMLIHADGRDALLDFFVSAPGREGIEGRGELVPIEVMFDETPQIFNVDAPSCGVPGTAAGLAAALERFGSVPMSELALPVAEWARHGVEMNGQQAYIFEILEAILTRNPEGQTLYAPAGQILREGETFRFPDLADALERYAAEGPAPFYEGDIAAKLADWVRERGGTLSRPDLAAYEVVVREPARAAFHGYDVLTNPPPSSGGILIAYCLDILERLGSGGVEAVVFAMEEAQNARDEDFHAGLYGEGFLGEFLVEERLLAAAHRVGERLGSTTHISALDAEGRCASVTCSNGSGSGVIVPGTGIHLNNMLGEEDLNPTGFFSVPPGLRMPSMMSPTIVLHEGEIAMGLGSGGSNRIRSAILQTILRFVADGMDVERAVRAPRLHYEAGAVQAEPGIDEEALRSLEGRGYEIARWKRPNLFFGGVHAVTRDPGGGLSGAGDPRRGGAVALA
jgi:gamma-glutamyltranspeptidase/glutathione hydrolase